MLVIIDQNGNKTEIKNDVLVNTLTSIILSVLTNKAQPVQNIVISVNGTPYKATAQGGGSAVSFSAPVTFQNSVSQISATLSINSTLIAEATAQISIPAGQYTFIWIIGFQDQTNIVSFAFTYWATSQIKSVSISTNGNSVQVSAYANTVTFFVQYAPQSGFSNSYPTSINIDVTFNLTDNTSVTGTVSIKLPDLPPGTTEPIALLAVTLILAP